VRPTTISDWLLRRISFSCTARNLTSFPPAPALYPSACTPALSLPLPSLLQLRSLAAVAPSARAPPPHTEPACTTSAAADAMNTAAGPQWSQPEQFSDMAAIGDQEFANFVDLDLDIDDLNIPTIFDASGQSAANYVPVGDVPHQHDRPPHSQPAPADHIDQTANIFGVDMHMSFDGRQEHNFPMPQGHPHSNRPPNMIPPTPNSAELQSEAAARFLAQLDPQTRAQLIEQQYHQLRKAEAVRFVFTGRARPRPLTVSLQQTSFTPLVSPAVTPHDSRFHLPQEFNVQPGAYFSPLTSPALEGQIQSYHNNNTSASSVATSSPVDQNVDMHGEGTAPQQKGRQRQKRPNNARSASATTRVGKSPMVRPAQPGRKGTLPSVSSAKSMQQVVDQAQKPVQSPTSPTAPHPPYTQTSSGTGSISPEPLSDVMGPPPKPASAQPSPAIHAQSRTSSASTPNPQAVPATPSTLLKAREAQAGGLQQPLSSPNGAVMEELNLPEPADSSRPVLGRIDTSAMDDCDTPRMTARKTPKLGPLSTPGSSALSGANKSRGAPITSAVTSPTSATMSPVTRKSESRGGRGSKKRASMSSSNALVSPALRPKISPSIRPMIPVTSDGNVAMDEAMQTHFLTQRSNYQNLIEGTHVPGVSYPSELSTNLTSKRTSHKIAILPFKKC